MSNENLTGIQGDTRKRLSVSFQLDDKDSKTDVHETTQDMNRILNLSNENISSTLGKFLNPDAPDFKPSDSKLSLHSLPAQGHKQRRATHSEVYDKHHSRQRNFSDTYANIDPSTIPSLLSIVPQYIPKHRRSWTATMPTTTASSSQSSTSNSSWWPQEYSNPSSLASSYQSRTAYQMYTPLMEVESSTIEQEPSDDQQQSYPPNRPRALSGRIFPSSSLMSMNTRKRSHSGPEPPLTLPSSHLSGIHSLTRIMVDILRRIKPIIEENKETTNLVANDENLTVNSTSNQQNQSVNQITEPENILNDKQTSSTAMPLSTMSIEQTEGNRFLFRTNWLSFVLCFQFSHQSDVRKQTLIKYEVRCV